MSKGGRKSIDAISEMIENQQETYEDKTLFNAVYEISCEYFEEGITEEMLRCFAGRLRKLQNKENISDQNLGEFIGASHTYVQQLRTIGCPKPTKGKEASGDKEASNSKKAVDSKAYQDKKNSEKKITKPLNQAHFVGICLRFECSPNYLFGDTDDPEQFLYKHPRFINGDSSAMRVILERCQNCVDHKKIKAYKAVLERCQNCTDCKESEAQESTSVRCQNCADYKEIEAYKAIPEHCQNCADYKEIEAYKSTLKRCQNCADYREIEAYKATEKGKKYIRQLRESLCSKVSMRSDDSEHSAGAASLADSKNLLKCQTCPGFMTCSAFSFRRDFKLPIYPLRNLASIKADMVLSTLCFGVLPPGIPNDKQYNVRNMMIDTFAYLLQVSSGRRTRFEDLLGRSFGEFQKRFKDEFDSEACMGKPDAKLHKDTPDFLKRRGACALWTFMHQSIDQQRLLLELKREILDSLEYQSADYCDLICGIAAFDLKVAYNTFWYLNRAKFIPRNIKRHRVFSEK